MRRAADHNQIDAVDREGVGPSLPNLDLKIGPRLSQAGSNLLSNLFGVAPQGFKYDDCTHGDSFVARAPSVAEALRPVKGSWQCC